MDLVEFANQLDTEFRASCARLKRDDPWFGQFTLQSDGKTRTYRVGAVRSPDERIVDWRHPLARAYYDAEPGEEFELDQRGFAKLSGVVETLTTLTAQARRVRRVELRNSEGRFELSAGEAGFEPHATPRRGPTQAEGLPDVLSLLTPAQYRLITASRNQPVVIQGRAGWGKTTVALYRVAWLTYADEGASETPVDPDNVLIVMFNRALSTFVRSGLKALKLDGVNLDTFHGWALSEIRRSYRGTIEMRTKLRANARSIGPTIMSPESRRISRASWSGVRNRVPMRLRAELRSISSRRSACPTRAFGTTTLRSGKGGAVGSSSTALAQSCNVQTTRTANPPAD